MATVKDTVRELGEPIKVHYHGGDREPRLTPLELSELENLHTRAIELIIRLDKTIVASEQLSKVIYEQKVELEKRITKMEYRLQLHGRWLRSAGKTNIWYCSFCGGKINYKQNRRTYNIEKIPVEQKNKFCRNCGAKMDAKEVETDGQEGT